MEVGWGLWVWLRGTRAGAGLWRLVGFGDGAEWCVEWIRCVGKAKGFGSGAQSVLPCPCLIRVAGYPWGAVPTI